MKKKRPSPSLLLLPTIFYVLSFLVPHGREGHIGDGFSLFVAGGMCAFVGIPTALTHGDSDGAMLSIALCWLANPLFWIGVILLQRGRYATAFGFGIGASALAMQIPFLKYIKDLDAEPCWYAWTASMVILAFASLLAPAFADRHDEELTQLRSVLDALRDQIKTEQDQPSDHDLGA